MLTHSLLRAVVATAALATIAAPAAAEPIIHQDLCTVTADCVTVHVDPDDPVTVEGDLACPDEVAEECATSAGSSTTTTPGSGASYTCSWSKNTATVSASVPPRGTVQPAKITTSCTVYERTFSRGTVTAVGYRAGTVTATGPLSAGLGGRTVACVSLQVSWSDGTATSYVPRGGGCTPS